jgi:hypothetical protein
VIDGRRRIEELVTSFYKLRFELELLVGGGHCKKENEN